MAMETTDADRIHQIVERTAALYPERVALQVHANDCLGDRYTYARLVECFKSGATRLRACGLQPGDRVVLLAANSPEWAIAYLAALSAAVTVVLLDPTLTGAELVSLIRSADPRAMLLSHQLYAQLGAELKFEFPVLDIQGGLAAFAVTPTSVNAQIPPTPDPDETIASILFTSGTTSKPKGVLLGHASIIHNTRALIDRTGQSDTNVCHQVLAVLPLNHLAGLLCTCLAPLFTGATVTFLATVSGETILAAMQATHTTILPGVPRLFELFYSKICQQVAAKGWLTRLAVAVLGRLNQTIRTHTTWNPGAIFFRSIHQTFGGSLELSCCGAAPLAVEVERGLERLGFTMMKAYGLTETGIVVVNGLQPDRLGHVGKPLQAIEIRIAQPHPSSGEGEICVRGKTLMQGYFRDRAATEAVMRAGWFHTGDLGRCDAQGNLLITGRIKELIVTPGGKKAAPLAVEAYYQGLPGVRELAVVGIPKVAGGGDDIHCAVVLTEAGDRSQQQRELESSIHQRAADVPAFLRIQKVHVVAELPKTSTLKVKRAELRQQLTIAGELPAPLAATAAELDEIARRTIAIVSAASGCPTVRLGSTLQFDLGIDSLGLVELAGKLEKAFGIQLNERHLPTFDTVERLVMAVRTAIARGDEVVSPAEFDRASTEQIAPTPARRGFWAKVALSGFAFISRLCWRIEVSGIEHVPVTGAFILCPNHESHLDTFWVAASLPRSIRHRLCCFAKQEHFERPFTKLLATIVGAIPTDRDGDILPTLRAGAKMLREHRPLSIHPEGTRTRTGEMLPFRRGAAKLAIASNVPLVPVRLIGSYEIFSTHQRLPSLWNWKQHHRHTLRIIFGAPIFPPPLLPTETAEVELTQQLRQAVISLGTAPVDRLGDN
jgi:long-chain acyl-CoA synthetase